MITKADMPKLLGRSLTSLEDSNYDLYIDIALERLNGLLCFDARNGDVVTKRARVGYSEIKLEPFTAISAVTVDGTAVTNYTLKQNDSYSAPWFNLLEFDERFTSEKLVSITATWGFGSDCSSDLAQLFAKLFNLISTEKGTSGQVKSKSIEYVSVTYDNSVSPLDSLISENMGVIAKYSACGGYVRSGDAGLASQGL